MHDRGATHLEGREIPHTGVGTDLAKRRLERLIFHELERLRKIRLRRSERGGAKRKELPEEHGAPVLHVAVALPRRLRLLSKTVSW